MTELCIVHDIHRCPSLVTDNMPFDPDPDTKRYQCLECNFSCVSHSVLREHVGVTHASTGPSADKPAAKFYKCTHCDYSSSKMHRTKIHMEIHKSESLLKCGLCSFVCRSQNNLSNHYSSHKRGSSTIQKYTCSKCSYVTKYKSLIILHIRVKHFIPAHHTFTRSHLKGKNKNLISTLNYTQSHQTLLRCSYCSFETDDGTKMVEHSNNHTDVNSKVYQCRECWYSTNDPNCYRGHMGIHSNWRPHKCMSCSFSCKRRYSLRRHQKTVHASGRKLLQCPLCSYVNVNEHLITSHYKTQHGRTRLYSCDVCDYKSYTKRNLELHSVIHSSDRPHKCSECAYTAKTALPPKSYDNPQKGPGNSEVPKM